MPRGGDAFARFRIVSLAAALCAAPASSAELTLLQVGQEGLGSVATLGRRGLAATGGHVYVSTDAFLLVLSRQADGKLEWVEPAISLIGDPLDDPEGIAVAPGGAHVYVAGPLGTVGVFERDAQTGMLDSLDDGDQSEGLEGSAGALAVSPDGAWLYVTSPGSDGLVVYSRSGTSGAIELAQRLEEGQEGVSGLADAKRLAVSPDGAHVYVGGTTQGAAAIAALRRETDGSLAFVEREREGEEGVDALGEVAALLVAPDGEELLALSAARQRVLRFRRQADGGLVFTEAVPLTASGGGPVPWPAGWMAIRPDGRRLYVGAFFPFATLTYARAASGELSFAGQAEGAGAAGVVSPDGGYVYSTGTAAVRVFVPEPGAWMGAGAGLATLLALARARRPGGRLESRPTRSEAQPSEVSS